MKNTRTFRVSLFCRNFVKLCGVPGFWEIVLGSFSCFHIEIANRAHPEVRLSIETENFFCPSQPTVTFSTQLLDSLTYRLFSQRYEDMIFPKGGGGEFHDRQLSVLGGLAAMTPDQNVRNQG